MPFHFEMLSSYNTDQKNQLSLKELKKINPFFLTVYNKKNSNNTNKKRSRHKIINND